MKIINQFTILGLFFLVYVQPAVFAQKLISTPTPGAGKIVKYSHFKGTVGNIEIRDEAKTLVYENKKKLAAKELVVNYKGEKYDRLDFLVKGDKILTYFVSDVFNPANRKLCIQEFDLKLNPVGNPVELLDLSQELAGKNLKNNKLKYKDVLKNNLSVLYNEKTGTLLFYFTMQLAKEFNSSFVKAVLVDKDYTILNTFDYKASSPENYIRITPQRILENDDAVFTLADGKDNMTNYTYEIDNQAQIILPADGEEGTILELMPDGKRITFIKTAENLTNDGKIVYSIGSSFYDENNKETYLYFSVYKYKSHNDSLDRQTYRFTINDVFPEYKVLNATSFYARKIYNLEDGSILMWLAASNSIWDYGSILVKIDPYGEIDWIKGFRKETEIEKTMYSAFLGYVDYFDSNGNFNLIFNFDPKKVNNNELKECLGKKNSGFNATHTRIGPESSRPYKATINLENGEITISEFKIEGENTGAIFVNETQTLDDTGKIKLHMYLNKKLVFADVDMNQR